jgi:hypothetical protein
VGGGYLQISIKRRTAMKKVCRTLMLVVLVMLALGSMLWAEDPDGEGAVRGTFVRLVEREVDERGYMGIVVKPFERDDHVTVLVPREREELLQTARSLQEGQRMGISFVTEAGHMWIKGMEAERRERVEERPEGGRRVAIRREVRRRPGQIEDRPEDRRMRTFRGDPDREQFRAREERDARRPSPHLEQMERQLKEVVAGHLERMGRELKEVLGAHLGRMEAEFRELRAHVGRMERELQAIRGENERLRMQLRERAGPGREQEGRLRERREVERRREDVDREERDLRPQREQRIEVEIRREDNNREQREVPRERDDEGEPGVS